MSEEKVASYVVQMHNGYSDDIEVYEKTVYEVFDPWDCESVAEFSSKKLAKKFAKKWAKKRAKALKKQHKREAK